MTELQLAQRGEDAARVLENPAFREAMDLLKQSIVETWKSCPIRDQEAQTITLQKMRITEDFESLLIGLVQGGELAAKKLKDKERTDKFRNEGVVQSMTRRFYR